MLASADVLHGFLRTEFLTRHSGRCATTNGSPQLTAALSRCISLDRVCDHAHLCTHDRAHIQHAQTPDTRTHARWLFHRQVRVLAEKEGER
jgi:hypothetical protein